MSTRGTSAPVDRAYKRAWQRNMRRAFIETYGYSTNASYATGGLREAVLERDGRRCVKCGMTDEEHKARWGRPITVDHIDKNRGRNEMANLQTICLRCHGRKDQLPQLRVPRVVEHKETVLSLRATGVTYRQIAHELGFSIAAIWKWARRWEAEGVGA